MWEWLVARAQAARYDHVPGLGATAKMSCSVTQRAKAKKRGASRDVHAMYVLPSNSRPRPAPQVLGVVASTKLIARAWITLRGCICACVLAIDRFCDNAEGFARMCLIMLVSVRR